MSKQINRNEIAEKGVLDNLLEPLKELLKVTDRVDAKLKDTAKTINESFKFSESSKGLRELEVNLKKTNKLAEQKKKVQQDQTKIEKQLADAKGRLNKLNVQEEQLLKAKLQTDQQSIKVQDQKKKQLITEERLKQAQLRTDKQIQAEKEKEARQNAKLAKQKADENNAYKQLSKASRDYKNESKRLGAELLKLEQAGRKNTKEFRDLSNQYKTVTAQARTTDEQLKKLDKTVGDNFRNVGDYENAIKKAAKELDLQKKTVINNIKILNKQSKTVKKSSTEYKLYKAEITKNETKLNQLNQTINKTNKTSNTFNKTTSKLTSSLGALGLAVGVGAIFRNVGGIISNFNQAQQDLLAISGKSAEELSGLTQQAKDLGASTAFSATQITGLQIELAKLGFTTNEITQSTGGISAFASATGADLPQAAKLAGSALRAFNLDASEMDRVVSVLGVATTKTALDVSALETGLSSVAPVAASFGFSIEDTTALLGQLSNAGFDASSAATSTRNILLNLADANGALAQKLGRPIKSADDLAGALQELQSQGVDLGEALELTDKRSVAAFQTFMNGADSLVGLRDSITDVNDELKEMEEKRLDSVNGQMQLLNSAWEGFILGTDEATGASNALKNVIGFLAENLELIITSIGKMIIGFTSYRAVLFAVNIQQKLANTNVRQLARGFFTLGKNSKDAGSNVGGMGKALKGIGWSALIAVAIELAVSFYDIASGAKEAREQAQLLDEMEDEFNKDRTERSEQRMKQIRDEQEANEQAFRREEITKDELLKKNKELIEQAQYKAKMDVRGHKLNIEFIEEQLSVLDKVDVVNGQILNGSEELAEALREVGIEGAEYDDTWATMNITGTEFNSIQAQLRKSIELNKVGIEGYNEEISELDKMLREVTTQEIENTNSREDNRSKINAQVKGLKDQNKELQKQVLTIEDIQKLLDSGESLEDIEDSEIGQLTDAIDKDLTERITKINDFERDRTLTEKEASDQRLIAEIDALNEKRRIYELYDRDVTDIDKELSEKRLALSKEFLQKDKDIQEDVADNVRQTVEQVGNAIADIYSDIFQRQIDELKNQEDIAKQVYGTLEKLASEGNIAAQESLAEQIQAQQDAQREQIRLQQKQANIEKARQVYAIIQSQLDAGKSPGQAIAQAGGYMTAIQGLIQSLPSFYEGTEDTGKASKALDSKGGRLAVLHNNERVLTADQNKHLQGIPNPMIPVLVNKALDSAGNSYDLLAIDELRRTRQAIEKLPQSTYQLESAMGQIVKMVATHKTGNSTTKNTYK